MNARLKTTVAALAILGAAQAFAANIRVPAGETVTPSGTYNDFDIEGGGTLKFNKVGVSEKVFNGKAYPNFAWFGGQIFATNGTGTAVVEIGTATDSSSYWIGWNKSAYVVALGDVSLSFKNRDFLYFGSPDGAYTPIWNAKNVSFEMTGGRGVVFCGRACIKATAPDCPYEFEDATLVGQEDCNYEIPIVKGQVAFESVAGSRFHIGTLVSGSTVTLSPVMPLVIDEAEAGAHIALPAAVAGSRFTVSIGSAYYDFTSTGEAQTYTCTADGLVLTSGAKLPNVAASSGTVSLGDDWQKSVALWIDPTDLDTMKENLYKPGTSSHPEMKIDGVKYPLIERCFDCRGGSSSDYMLLNDYRMTGTSGERSPTSVLPTLMTNDYTVGGVILPYLRYYRDGYNRRLRFHAYTEDPNATGNMSIKTRHVIMAFGAQDGGGTAIVAHGGNAFARAEQTKTDCTYSDPIFTNATITTWLNGKRVNPSTTGFSNGWQIVSFDADGKALQGFGYNISPTTQAGDQRYGDILIFTNDITDVQRIAAERYLAKKWGLADYYEGGDDCWRLSGTGDVEAKGIRDLTLGGAFSGSLTLDGATVTIADETLPPSEADIAKLSPTYWFDPDAEGAVRLYERADRTNPPIVCGLYDRLAGDLAGATMLYAFGPQSTDTRCPYLFEGVRGTGVSRKRLDFMEYYTDMDAYGNTIRFRQVPWANDTVVVQKTVKTGFVVFDSTRPGGAPIVSKVGGNADDDYGRTQSSDPIWRSKSTIDTRLDGVTVDGTEVGFGCKPEVMSFVKEAGFTMHGMGRHEGNANGVAGELIGESVFFDSVVSDDVRRDVEAYLMGKWLGRLPAGYGDVRGATLKGSGEVFAARAKQLPKCAADFSGTVTAESGEMAFGLDGDVVSGALSLGGADLVLPAAVTVTVNLLRRPKAGDYVLATARSISGASDLAVVLAGVTDDWPVSLRIVGGNLVLTVQKKGMLVIVQ